MKIFKPSKILIFTIICGNFYFDNPVLANSEPYIRVLLNSNTQLRIRADKTNELIVRNLYSTTKRLTGLNFLIENGQFKFKNDFSSEWNILDNDRKIRISTFGKRGIWLGQRRYFGDLFLFIDNNKINVVNKIKIEKYLSSVVGSEMPHSWHMEALKAQAIASRTYALNQKKNYNYDIDATTNNQVYLGAESITKRTSQAVRNTRSLVLTYKNKLINAVFHSSSGGYTEPSENVWKNKFPYLVSVKDYDKINPKFKWKIIYELKYIDKLFPEIENLKSIQITKISKTGRVQKIKLIGNNKNYISSGKEIRSRLNLKSNLFRIKLINYGLKSDNINSNDSKSFVITGLGAGHGVGMSQWGAYGMAIKGFNSKQILYHFYRGTKIKPFKEFYKL